MNNFLDEAFATLFPSARKTDPISSQLTATRAGRVTVAQKLLAVFYDHTREGGLPLTDNHAGELAGVRSAHKRCGELRKLGLIETHHVGACPLTGERAMRSIITRHGEFSHRNRLAKAQK